MFPLLEKLFFVEGHRVVWMVRREALSDCENPFEYVTKTFRCNSGAELRRIASGPDRTGIVLNAPAPCHKYSKGEGQGKALTY